jgi:nucleotide-binding universal stress UspA family protein
MYANILLSTDGSDVARKGVEHGIVLAKGLNAKVTVITVTEPLPVYYGNGHASGWMSEPTSFAGWERIRNHDTRC